MVRELDPDKPFSEQKLFTSLAKGERFKLAGVTTSKVQAYDSLARAYGLLSSERRQQPGKVRVHPRLAGAQACRKASEVLGIRLPRAQFLHSSKGSRLFQEGHPSLPGQQEGQDLHGPLVARFRPLPLPRALPLFPTQCSREDSHGQKAKDGGSAMARSPGNSRK